MQVGAWILFEGGQAVSESEWFYAQDAQGSVGKCMRLDDYEKLERELAEWKARAEAMIAATISHVDGRDLLAELKPMYWHFCNIKVRINGQWKEYEGDWLKRLYQAREQINAAQAAQNAAAGSGGHCSVASDSRESPGAGHCQPAAPDADAQVKAGLKSDTGATHPLPEPASSAMVLVPREPTKEMLGAAFREIMKAPKGTKDGDSMRIFYRAMLSAAPASGPSEEAVRIANDVLYGGHDPRFVSPSVATLAREILRLVGRKP